MFILQHLTINSGLEWMISSNNEIDYNSAIKYNVTPH